MWEWLRVVVRCGGVEVGVNQAWLWFVVAQAGPGIELLDPFQRVLDDLEGPVERAGYFLKLIGLNLLEMFGNDLLRQRILRIKRFQLPQQAFTQIPRAHSDRVEVLDHGQRVIQIILRILSVLRQFLGGSRQIAVLVQIANDAIRDLFYLVRTDRDAQLPL